MDIKLIHITKKYGSHTVLNDFNLFIENGEMIAITGESGKGKSTLLNIIGLLEEPDSGDVFIKDIKNPKPNSRKTTLLLRNTIGYLFQNYALIDTETVEKNLKIALAYQNLEKKNEIIKDVLLQVGLGDKLKSKVFELSGGEQQRVALARLILKPCDIILADEPTGSLDSENRNQVLEILKGLNNKGKTIIIVTHDQEVANICSRVIKL